MTGLARLGSEPEEPDDEGDVHEPKEVEEEQFPHVGAAVQDAFVPVKHRSTASMRFLVRLGRVSLALGRADKAILDASKTGSLNEQEKKTILKRIDGLVDRADRFRETLHKSPEVEPSLTQSTLNGSDEERAGWDWRDEYTTDEADRVFQLFLDHLEQPVSKQQICRLIGWVLSADIGYLLTEIRKMADRRGLALSYFDASTRTWTMTAKNADLIMEGVFSRTLEVLTYLQGLHMQVQWLDQMCVDDLDRRVIKMLSEWSE